MRYVLVGIAVLGCKSAHEHSRPAAKAVQPMFAGSGGAAEVTIGGTRSDDAGSLAFTITKIVPARQPASAPPWHAAGGTWTYFEARLASDDAATFAVLVPAFDGSVFGKMQLLPTTAVGGARVVAAFARAFHVAAPPAVPGGQLAPLVIPLAVLGVHTGRSNGFSGEGTWTATKWFCTTDSVDVAEVFFNFSLDDKRGELSEKDAAYDADIAACLATVLRDGQPPPRTPATDPTLAVSGPEIVIGKQIGSKRAHPGCCKWLDDRYLEFHGNDFGFIDTDAMKLSFVPHAADGDDQDVTIAPGMAIAIVRRGDGIFLATIKRP